MLLTNRYQIVQMLGEGGFGQTFLAEDLQMPSKRRCVIKQLKPMTNEPTVYQVVQERFQREAAILEKLGEKHPQIPKLYAYFSDSGQFYLVQEWIEGKTLEQLVMDQTVFDESTVRKILLDLLPVLEFIHSQGMIHRDIKPENIILRNVDRLPVLIDFGAVRETMGTVFNSRGNPTSSIIIGTPGYMSAEQAAGRPIPSSDLYSLGLTAIYLLTGKTPQMLDTDPQSGEILWQQYAPQLSPAFAAVLTQMVRSHPRDRYSSAAELRAALDSGAAIAQTSPMNTAVIGSNPSTVVMGSPASTVSTPTASNRSKLIIAGIVGGGLLALAIVASFFLNRERQNVPTVIAQSPGSSVSPSPTASAKPDSTPPNPSNQGSVPVVPGNSPSTRPSPDSIPAASSPSTPQSNGSMPVNLVGSPGSQIPVYSQPSTQSSSPHYGVPNDRVIVKRQVTGADQAIWYYIKFPSGAEGWIQRSQTSMADEKPVKPNDEPPTKPSTSISATLVGQTPGSRVNVRSAPSTSASSPSYGLVGDRVEILDRTRGDDGRVWFYVKFASGVRGWIREDFIRGDG